VEEDGGKWETIKKVLKVPMVWYMGFTYFCLKLIRYGLIFWLPLYFVQEMSFSPASAGLAATLFELGGVPSVIVIGVISDRLFQSRRGPTASIPLFFLAGFCLIQHLLGRAGPVWAMVGFALMGFALYGPDSLMCGAGAMDFGTRKGASTAAGFVNGMGSVGAILQGLIIPRLKLFAGWHGIFILFFGISLLSALIMLSQWNTIPEKE
jgi:OPA family sugar phosphate sensor protein UhpC-like MFS transporter